MYANQNLAENRHQMNQQNQALLGAHKGMPMNQVNEMGEDIFYEPLSDEDRPGFIRKVYGILSIQLLFTACFSGLCIFMSDGGANISFIKMMVNPAIYSFVIVMYIVSICALVCCGQDLKVPNNYIWLVVFTVCVSWMVGVACMSVRDTMVVLEAAAMTAAMVIGLTIYAIRTKTDFTMCGGALYIFGMVFLTAMLFAIVFGGHLMNLGIACLGVILFGFYLIYDTQMIIGGKHRRYQFDKERYILAAVTLYLDIINIFLYILAILEGEKRE